MDNEVTSNAMADFREAVGIPVDAQPFDIVNGVELRDDVPPIPAMDVSDVQPSLITLPELPEEVRRAMEKGPSDIDLLNQRITALEKLIRDNHAEDVKVYQYLCQSMSWLVTMLSGVAQLAQNMPGMGGIMAKMLKGGK